MGRRKLMWALGSVLMIVAGIWIWREGGGTGGAIGLEWSDDAERPVLEQPPERQHTLAFAQLHNQVYMCAAVYHLVEADDVLMPNHR